MCVRTCMCAFALAVAYRSFCLHALAVQAVLQRLQIDDDQERVSFDQINEGLEYLDTWNAVVRSVLCFFECGGKVGRYLGTWNAAVTSLVCFVECGGKVGRYLIGTWNAAVRILVCIVECGGKVGRYLIGTWNAAVRSLVCIVECGGEEAGVLYQAHNCG